MKAEFNNRVDLQRQVLKIINAKSFKTQLSGLSKPALDSWVLSNHIEDSNLKQILYSIGEKLFFVANKSQDQITEEYKDLQFSIQKDMLLLKNSK